MADLLELRETINASCYVQRLHNLHRALRDKYSGGKITLQHDNAPSHSTRCTVEEIEKVGWEVLPYPLYSSDLALSDYCLFGFVKDQIRGQRFETIEGIQTAVRQCLPKARMEFNCKGIFKVPEWSEKCVQKGSYV